jgi:hypothetical protein
VPDPGIVSGGTVLAEKGTYYLLRIKSTVYNQHVEIQLEDKSRYKVDLIDPWLMKVYALGYTSGGLQAFDPSMTPCLLRFVRVEDSNATDAAPIQTLIARFLKDPTIEKPPVAVAIQVPAPHYSQEYTIGELLENPQTSELVKKYLPSLPSFGWVRAMTVEQIWSMAETSNPGDPAGLIRELEKIPVPQK